MILCAGYFLRNMQTFRWDYITITFCWPSCLGHETAKGPFGLRIKLQPVYLDDGGFMLTRCPLFTVERQAGVSANINFYGLWFDPNGDQTQFTVSVADVLYPRDHWSAGRTKHCSLKQKLVVLALLFVIVGVQGAENAWVQTNKSNFTIDMQFTPSKSQQKPVRSPSYSDC